MDNPLTMTLLGEGWPDLKVENSKIRTEWPPFSKAVLSPCNHLLESKVCNFLQIVSYLYLVKKPEST